MKKRYTLIATSLFIACYMPVMAQLSTVYCTTIGGVYYQSFDGLTKGVTPIQLAAVNAPLPVLSDISASPVSATGIAGWQVLKSAGSTTAVFNFTPASGGSTGGSFYS